MYYPNFSIFANPVRAININPALYSSNYKHLILFSTNGWVLGINYSTGSVTDNSLCKMFMAFMTDSFYVFVCVSVSINKFKTTEFVTNFDIFNIFLFDEPQIT